MHRQLLLSLFIGCVVAGCSRTQSTTTSVPAAVTAPATSAEQNGADQKAARAYIDPDTGQMRAPTAAELAAEAAKRSATPAVKDRAPVEEIKLPNGMTEVRVGKSAEVSEITCIQADSSLGPCSPAEAASLRAGNAKPKP